MGESRIDDGDALNKRDAPWIESKSPPILKGVNVAGGLLDSTHWQATVMANVTLAEKPDDVVAKLKYELLLDQTGRATWHYEVKWLAIDMQAWEFGLKFSLPSGDDHFSWYRRGQWTEYPAGHIGANQGSSTPTDISFQSTKRDIVWASVVSGSGIGAAFAAADGPLHVRCRSDKGGTTFFASSAVAPERSFSSGYCDAARILLMQGHTYEGSFQTWPTSKEVNH